jgi:hypothetical protein
MLALLNWSAADMLQGYSGDTTLRKAVNAMNGIEVVDPVVEGPASKPPLASIFVPVPNFLTSTVFLYRLIVLY